MDNYGFTLESEALNTIKVWLHLIPDDKVIERDTVLKSVVDIWVSFAEVEKTSNALFKLLSDPTNVIYAKQIKKELSVTPEELHGFVGEINITLNNLVKAINKYVPRYTVKNEMTVRQGAILEYSREIVQIATVLSSYLVNVTYVIQNTAETKERTKLIKVAMPTLRRAIKEHLGKTEDKLDEIIKLSDSIKVLNNLSVLDSSDIRLVNGNFGNPIWALRKFFVDRDKLTHDKLKAEAQLIELRILALQTGETPNLEERVAYYEEKLALITKKMKNLERQYDDE